MAVVPAHCGRYEEVHSRREFLAKSAFGFGTLALGHLLERQALASGVNHDPGNQGVHTPRSLTQPRPTTQAADPLAPRPPHLPAKAKSVIFLFMTGGPSHLETFDPKPLLRKL